MNFFAVFIVAILLFSLYSGYKVYLKLLKKQHIKDEKNSLFGKILLLFFTSLIIVSLNILTLVLSYSYIWEKTFRAYNEQKYEAVVIGYKKEEIKTQNFKSGSYYNRLVFFPKVKYKNQEGQEIIKTVDITSDSPFSIGDTMMITDSTSQNNANVLDLNWIMLLFLTLFTAIGVFFSSLIFTFSKDFTMKKRMHYSLYVAVFIIFINSVCIISLYLKI